jgi:hypothetical protein
MDANKRRALGRRMRYLKQVIKVQQAYQIHKVHPGVFDKWIFDNHIKEPYNINYGTFLKYIGIPAQKLFKEAENEYNNHD